MPTILITGANGFIGKHLLTYLRTTSPYQGWRVVLLTSTQVAGYDCVVRPDYQLEPTDLVKLGIEKLDAFIHLGGFIPKSQVEVNDIAKCTANITVTLRCLSALPQQLSRLLYISSVDVYSSETQYIQENSLASPVNLYGWSKLYTEHMVHTWAEQHQVVCQVLRLGHIYGPGEEAYQKLIPHTIRLMQQGKAPVILTDGTERRAFLYVEDCCRMIMKALDLAAYAGPINIASSYSISVLELIQLIQELTGNKQPAQIKNSIQTKRDLTFDTTKRRELLGKEEIELRNGLAQEISSFNYQN